MSGIGYRVSVEDGAKPRMAGYRQLRVWQAAMDLVEAIYLATRTYPQGSLAELETQVYISGRPGYLDPPDTQ